MSRDTVLGIAVLLCIAGIIVCVVAGIIAPDALLGLAPTVLAYLTTAPKAPKAPKVPPAAALVLTLGASLALSACAGGQLHPDAVPYVEPLVIACPAECAAVADDCGEWASDLDGERAKWGVLLCVVWTAACPGLCAEAGEHVGGNP
jgi:hypothetical protein